MRVVAPPVGGEVLGQPVVEAAVDLGAAADAAPLGERDPGVAERGARALVAVPRDELVERERLVLVGSVPGPFLDDEHRAPGLGEAGRGDRAAGAGADERTSVSIVRFTATAHGFSSCWAKRTSDDSRRGYWRTTPTGWCSQPVIERRIAARSGSGPWRSRTHAPSPTRLDGDAEPEVLGHRRERRADEGRDRTAGALVVVAREGGHDAAFQPEHERGDPTGGRRSTIRGAGRGPRAPRGRSRRATRIAGSAPMRNRWFP